MKKESLMNEIERLWDDGHAEALRFWGAECVKKSERGMLLGTITVCTFMLISNFLWNKEK